MTMQELKRYTQDELDRLEFEMMSRGNLVASDAIRNFKRFYSKRVRVFKGKKVPIGTEGIVFWMGSTDYSKYGDPWGIYTQYRAGIKDDEGNVYWTNISNLELV